MKIIARCSLDSQHGGPDQHPTNVGYSFFRCKNNKVNKCCILMMISIVIIIIIIQAAVVSDMNRFISFCLQPLRHEKKDIIHKSLC